MRATALALGIVVLIWMTPARAQPCPGVPPWAFVDVTSADAFCASITFMATSGVTTGCQVIDANNRLFCPETLVTRKQMAGFMSRFASGAVFAQGGNAFGTTGVLGTNDDRPLDIRVNGARVMRYEPHATSPNVVGGSSWNDVTAGAAGATIGGGGRFSVANRVTDNFGTVSGGEGNVAGDGAGTTSDEVYSTVGGGAFNTASRAMSTIAGGNSNEASGTVSTIGGGYDNTASGAYSTIGGGSNNTASGSWSVVPGGSGNSASGQHGFAAGLSSAANANGCFVWGDTSTANAISCNDANRFVVRSLGGVFFFAGGTTQATYTGVALAPGGTAWVVASDRKLKENVETVNPQAVLQRLVGMPVATWSLKTQDASIRHMGPMAQDFRAAFGLGESEVGINTIDADGVAFAAIQGLDAKLEDRVAALRGELRGKDAEIAALHARVAELGRAIETLLSRTGEGTFAASAR